MKCHKCKTELIDGAKYCHMCGIVILKRFTFISNEKKQKQIENILIEALKDVKKELDNVKEKVKNIEDKNNTIQPLTIPSQPIDTMPQTPQVPGIVTYPNTSDWYIYNTPDTGHITFGNGTTSSDSSDITFTTNSSSNLFVQTDGNVGI